MFDRRAVEIVSWGEDYTVRIVSGMGDRVDFDIYVPGIGAIEAAMGQCIDKVRVVQGFGETARYQVRMVR